MSEKSFLKWPGKGVSASRWTYALDIGSKKLALAAGVFGADGEPERLFIETLPSRGIFKGVVNDLSALSACIEQVFEKMETRTQALAHQAVVAISGNYINARESVAATALSERGTRSITRRDIEKLKCQARMLGLDLDETLLHEVPQGYSVDRHNMTLNPLSLHGRRFEMNLLLVSAKSTYLDNVLKAVEQAGVDAAGVCLSAVAAAEAVLSPQEEERGVALVDIGEAVTTVSVFKDGILRRLATLSFGARNLTEVIANFLKIPFEAADALKEGIEIESEIPADEEMMVELASDYKTIRRRDLVGIIQSEVETLTSTLKGVISDAACAEVLRNPVAVVGGLSLLEGFLEKMERDLGQPVRLGIPYGFKEAPLSKAASYAASVGALYWSRRRSEAGFFGATADGKNRIARAIDGLVHLYQDYF